MRAVSIVAVTGKVKVDDCDELFGDYFGLACSGGDLCILVYRVHPQLSAWISVEPACAKITRVLVLNPAVNGQQGT